MCFCISTAYEGTYLDSYYVDLLIKPLVKIQRHSVPVFIPLEQIAKKYLQTDIRRFLSVLSDHLNAYVGRRHQADQLEVPVVTATMHAYLLAFYIPNVNDCAQLWSAGGNLSGFLYMEHSPFWFSEHSK